jgi:uncharacterized membrane protein required for colicin V production
MISLFDLILALIIFGFFWFGFWYGLIYSVGAVLGIAAGAFAAGHYYMAVASYLSDDPSNFLKVIVFILIFGIVNKLVGLLFWLIDKIFHILTIIPFLKTINRLAGGILGLIEGSLTLGVAIYIYTKHPFSDWITEQLTHSVIAPWLLKVVAILKPFWPEILKQLKNLI